MILLFSDLHLREESESVVLGEVLPGIRKAACERGVTDIGFLGDWWHIRYTVNVRLFNAVRDELIQWGTAGLRLRLLPGNHDQVDVSGRNALEALGDLPHVTVFTEPGADLDGYWLPYRADPAVVADLAADSRVAAGASNTLFTHNAINGAMMNDHVRCTGGVDASALSGWEHVIAGHYHKRQTLGRGVTYIGSPYQTRADESGQPKGYALWDGQALQFVDTSWGPKHHRLSCEAGSQVDLGGVGWTDQVRVKVSGEGAHAAAEQLGKALTAAGYSNAVVVPDVLPMQARLNLDEAASLEQYALAYVEQAETRLDKERLVRAFRHVVGGDA